MVQAWIQGPLPSAPLGLAGRLGRPGCWEDWDSGARAAAEGLRGPGFPTGSMGPAVLGQLSFAVCRIPRRNKELCFPEKETRHSSPVLAARPPGSRRDGFAPALQAGGLRASSRQPRARVQGGGLSPRGRRTRSPGRAGWASGPESGAGGGRGLQRERVARPTWDRVGAVSAAGAESESDPEASPGPGRDESAPASGSTQRDEAEVRLRVPVRIAVRIRGRAAVRAGGPGPSPSPGQSQALG